MKFWIRCQVLVLTFILALSFTGDVSAQSSQSNRISSDPQYVIINLADIKEEYDWEVSDDEWNETVKPDLIKTTANIRETVGEGTDNRRLAWSVIVTYNEFPLDEPSATSPYVRYTQRILDVADEVNLPVFIPLNGFQWWNQLPELWNYWDPDGTQTPGCTNDDYASCPFPELQDPAFRERFIAGYDPDNTYNVEWLDWETPMPINTRDWGGGPFQHAPAPNLVDHDRTPVSFKDVQMDRTKVILEHAILPQLRAWQDNGKEELFAGVAFGTEVSLNATIGEDGSFKTYGYRGVQDMYCPADEPTCMADAPLDLIKLEEQRQQVVSQYLTDLTRQATELGLPKQRIYTHVWSEAQPEEKNKYVNYFAAAVNMYSRPGLSLYGYGTKPFELYVLHSGLRNAGEPRWAAPEFSTAPDSGPEALQASLANERNPAQLINLYNWREIRSTPIVPAIATFMEQSYVSPSCTVSEVFADAPIDKNMLSWSVMTDDAATTHEVRIAASKTELEQGQYLFTRELPIPEEEVQSFTVSTDDLEEGAYVWQVKRIGCDEKKWTTSLPGQLEVVETVWWKRFLNYISNMW
jgi:hypothetical protein